MKNMVSLICCLLIFTNCKEEPAIEQKITEIKPTSPPEKKSQPIGQSPGLIKNNIEAAVDVSFRQAREISSGDEVFEIDRSDFYDGKASLVVDLAFQNTVGNQDVRLMPSWKRNSITELREMRNTIHEKAQIEVKEVIKKSKAEQNAWLEQWNKKNQLSLKLLRDKEKEVIRKKSPPTPSQTDIDLLKEQITSLEPTFYEDDIYILDHILKNKIEETSTSKPNLENDGEYMEQLKVFLILSREYGVFIGESKFPHTHKIQKNLIN